MKNTLINLIVFSIAMALLETTVVVYLRELYYPDGFTVAFKVIKESILTAEICRELATLVMLFTIAYIAGKTKAERFAYFLIAFAIWDIFYYVWLKVFLNWPESLFTWDILFLIPVTWLAPVLAPVICSLTMILLGALILFIIQHKPYFELRKADWLLLFFGSVIILSVFIKDYSLIIIQNGWLLEIDSLIENEEFIRITSEFIPVSFEWGFFWIGEFILLGSSFVIAVREVLWSSIILMYGFYKAKSKLSKYEKNI